MKRIFFSVGGFGLLQQLLHLGPDLLVLLLHPVVAHGLVLAGVGLHLRTVERHPAQFHRPGLQSNLQYLLEHSRQRLQMDLSEIGYSAEVGLIARRQNPERDVLHQSLLMNPVLRGWRNYFRSGNAEWKFNQLDSYVWSRLTHWMYRGGGQRPGRFEKWSDEKFVSMGLYQLRGTVKYPAQATSVRSSLSRVRENRTHGLKGVV